MTTLIATLIALTLPQRKALAHAMTFWANGPERSSIRIVIANIADRVSGTSDRSDPITDTDLAIVLAFGPIVLGLTLTRVEEGCVCRAYYKLGQVLTPDTSGRAEGIAEARIRDLIDRGADTTPPPPDSDLAIPWAGSTAPTSDGAREPDLDFGPPGPGFIVVDDPTQPTTEEGRARVARWFDMTLAKRSALAVALPCQECHRPFPEHTTPELVDCLNLTAARMPGVKAPDQRAALNALFHEAKGEGVYLPALADLADDPTDQDAIQTLRDLVGSVSGYAARALAILAGD